MDARRMSPSHNRGTELVPRIVQNFTAHGPWPVVLDTVLLLKFAWCLKLCYSLLRGELTGTPAQKMSTIVISHTLVTLLELISFPGLQIHAQLFKLPWPQNPVVFFVQSFFWSMNDSAASIIIFVYLYRLPRRFSPSIPGYDPAAARDYRGWRSADMPMLAVFNVFTALLVVLNCAKWLSWDAERKWRAQRDDTQRDLRIRDMIRRGRLEREDGMVMGIVPSQGSRGAPSTIHA